MLFKQKENTYTVKFKTNFYQPRYPVWQEHLRTIKHATEHVLWHLFHSLVWNEFSASKHASS